MTTYMINIVYMTLYQLLRIVECTLHRILWCVYLEYTYKTNSVIHLVMTGIERGTGKQLQTHPQQSDKFPKSFRFHSQIKGVWFLQSGRTCFGSRWVFLRNLRCWMVTGPLQAISFQVHCLMHQRVQVYGKGTNWMNIDLWSRQTLKSKRIYKRNTIVLKSLVPFYDAYAWSWIPKYLY